jgi:FkbM family methyltransferase
LYFGKTNPGAKIFAFEPHNVSFRRAVENIGLNDSLKNISIFNMGLGSSPKKQKLYEVHPNNPGMNRILDSADYPYTEISIETLDHFIMINDIQNVDIIKLDVEGYEHEVLKGGILSIKKFHPVLLIELDDKYLKENNSSAKELIGFLNALGYNEICNAVDGQIVYEQTVLENCHIDIIAKYRLK